MKLRNKKNGIVEQCHIDCGYAEDRINFRCYAGATYDNTGLKTYNSLAELNEEWEDVPEERWYINENGGVMKYVPSDPNGEDLAYMKYQKEIGNYFKTKEEAEKAVKKLKAWKRLKDKGFEFEWVDKDTGSIKFAFFNREGKITKEMWQDIDLLFGGEE